MSEASDEKKKNRTIVQGDKFELNQQELQNFNNKKKLFNLLRKTNKDEPDDYNKLPRDIIKVNYGVTYLEYAR